MLWDGKISEQKHRELSKVRLKCPRVNTWLTCIVNVPICWTDVTFEKVLLKMSHASSAKLNCQNVASLASTGGKQDGSHSFSTWMIDVRMIWKISAEPEKHRHVRPLWVKVLCSSSLWCLCVWPCVCVCVCVGLWRLEQVANSRFHTKTMAKILDFSFATERLHSVGLVVDVLILISEYQHSAAVFFVFQEKKRHLHFVWDMGSWAMCCPKSHGSLWGPEQKAELGHSLHLLPQRERERERGRQNNRWRRQRETERQDQQEEGQFEHR